MSKKGRNRRRNKNKKTKINKEFTVISKGIDENCDLITAKENYSIFGSKDFLFIKKIRYKCRKLNNSFYSITTPNEKTVIITKNLFERIFV